MRFWMVPAALAAACVVGLATVGAIERYTENSVQDISIEVVAGAVGYTPDVGTVQDGIVHDIRATVSADRRYVQINVGAGMAIIERIDNFQVITD